MSKKDISILVTKYEQSVESGKPIYLDADEFDELANIMILSRKQM
jgi:hypothetical protein